MKVYISLPFVEVEIEREPMESEKFTHMWGCIVACVIAIGFFSVFVMLFG